MCAWLCRPDRYTQLFPKAAAAPASAGNGGGHARAESGPPLHVTSRCAHASRSIALRWLYCACVAEQWEPCSSTRSPLSPASATHAATAVVKTRVANASVSSGRTWPAARSAALTNGFAGRATPQRATPQRNKRHVSLRRRPVVRCSRTARSERPICALDSLVPHPPHAHRPDGEYGAVKDFLNSSSRLEQSVNFGAGQGGQGDILSRQAGDTAFNGPWITGRRHVERSFEGSQAAGQARVGRGDPRVPVVTGTFQRHRPSTTPAPQGAPFATPLSLAPCRRSSQATA